MDNLDNVDKRLLNLLQKGLPLKERPFLAISEEIKISEKDCIKKIKRLKEKQIIRQISAIFDTKSLGYKGSLVAMKFSRDRIDKTAEIINTHPGVSHNYERNHDINLWFTIAVPPSSSLREHIQRLGELTNAELVIILPTIRLFKIGVNLDLTENHKDIEETIYDSNYYSEANQGTYKITKLDESIIQELQEDIDLKQMPFHDMAKRCGISTMALLDRTEDFKTKGIIRRFAAVLRHREAGFSANVMGVWKVAEDRIEECGNIMASYKAVSHCYQRPAYPEWPYSIFTMIHEKSMKACEDIMKDIAYNTNNNEYLMLASKREFKKMRIKYFTGEVEGWERDNL